MFECLVPTDPGFAPLLHAQCTPSGEICHLEQHFITPPSRCSRKTVGGERVRPAQRTQTAWVWDGECQVRYAVWHAAVTATRPTSVVSLARLNSPLTSQSVPCWASRSQLNAPGGHSWGFGRGSLVEGRVAARRKLKLRFFCSVDSMTRRKQQRPSLRGFRTKVALFAVLVALVRPPRPSYTCAAASGAESSSCRSRVKSC